MILTKNLYFWETAGILFPTEGYLLVIESLKQLSDLEAALLPLQPKNFLTLATDMSSWTDRHVKKIIWHKCVTALE